MTCQRSGQVAAMQFIAQHALGKEGWEYAGWRCVVGNKPRPDNRRA